METAEEWQNRPLKKFYTFLFVDCLYVSIRKENETKSCAVYVILGYDVDGVKDILGLWIGEAEGKHYWMQIFDEIKARGVEDGAVHQHGRRCAEMHRAYDPQFSEICAVKGL